MALKINIIVQGSTFPYKRSIDYANDAGFIPDVGDSITLPFGGVKTIVTRIVRKEGKNSEVDVEIINMTEEEFTQRIKEALKNGWLFYG